MYINEIPATAPLFNKAGPEQLQEIIQHLHAASYHYADDSGREWGKAKQHVADAGKIANKCNLSFRAMQEIQKEAKPLMPLDDFINAALSAARNNSM